MFKAFSGALSLVLTFVVLRLAFPEASVLLAEILIKSLKIINQLIDLAMSTVLH